MKKEARTELSREHLESLTSLSATVHGRYPSGVLNTSNFVPDKIVIKYFLPLDSFQESSGIPCSCFASSGQRALLVLLTLFLILQSLFSVQMISNS